MVNRKGPPPAGLPRVLVAGSVLLASASLGPDSMRSAAATSAVTGSLGGEARAAPAEERPRSVTEDGERESRPERVSPSARASQSVQISLQTAYDRLFRWGRSARFFRDEQVSESAARVIDRIEDARVRIEPFPLEPAGVRYSRGLWTYCVVAPDWANAPYETGVPAGCRSHDLPVDYGLLPWRSLFQLTGENCRLVRATQPPSTSVPLDPPPSDEGCMRGLLVRLRGVGPGPERPRDTELEEPPEDPLRTPRSRPQVPRPTSELTLEGRIAHAAVERLYSAVIQRGRDDPYQLMVVVLEIDVERFMVRKRGSSPP